MIKFNDFSNKLVLITGGSSGIGLATACLLASEGANVWILARREEKLADGLKKIREAAAQPDQTFGMLEADVSSHILVNSVMKKMIREVGLPDLVINSAGVAHPGYVQGTDIKIFHWMMDVNFFGTVHVVKALLPGMMERRSGYIVNISSMAGFLGVFGYTAYSASKYAVRGFSDVLRSEMKPHGIGVSLVFPPDTETPQLAYEEQYKPAETKALTESGGRMSPENVAKSILKGIERGKYLILPGLENKLAYRLSGIFSNSVYPVMDWLVSGAQKKEHLREK
jgi:3-dehydrosphinganine reductase